MRLVIDTSVVFLLFKKNSFVLDFVKRHDLELYAPDAMINELDKHSEKICRLSNISFKQFDELKLLLETLIISRPVAKELLSKSLLMISDKKDAPFLALALEMGIPIWSNDQHFKEQKLVPVYSVIELKVLLDS